MIKDKLKTTGKQGQAFVQQLEQETSELMRRRAELEQLSHTKHLLRFLQSFTSPNAQL